MACSAEKEAQLKADGWVKRFMADEPRLGEAVREYQDLGLEVHLEKWTQRPAARVSVALPASSRRRRHRGSS